MRRRTVSILLAAITAVACRDHPDAGWRLEMRDHERVALDGSGGRDVQDAIAEWLARPAERLPAFSASGGLPTTANQVLVTFVPETQVRAVNRMLRRKGLRIAGAVEGPFGSGLLLELRVSARQRSLPDLAMAEEIVATAAIPGEHAFFLDRLPGAPDQPAFASARIRLEPAPFDETSRRTRIRVVLRPDADVRRANELVRAPALAQTFVVGLDSDARAVTLEGVAGTGSRRGLAEALAALRAHAAVESAALEPPGADPDAPPCGEPIDHRTVAQGRDPRLAQGTEIFLARSDREWQRIRNLLDDRAAGTPASRLASTSIVVVRAPRHSYPMTGRPGEPVPRVMVDHPYVVQVRNVLDAGPDVCVVVDVAAGSAGPRWVALQVPKVAREARLVGPDGREIAFAPDPAKSPPHRILASFGVHTAAMPGGAWTIDGEDRWRVAWQSLATGEPPAVDFTQRHVLLYVGPAKSSFEGVERLPPQETRVLIAGAASKRLEEARSTVYAIELERRFDVAVADPTVPGGAPARAVPLRPAIPFRVLSAGRAPAGDAAVRFVRDRAALSALAVDWGLPPVGVPAFERGEIGVAVRWSRRAISRSARMDVDSVVLHEEGSLDVQAEVHDEIGSTVARSHESLWAVLAVSSPPRRARLISTSGHVFAVDAAVDPNGARVLAHAIGTYRGGDSMFPTAAIATSDAEYGELWRTLGLTRARPEVDFSGWTVAAISFPGRFTGKETPVVLSARRDGLRSLVETKVEAGEVGAPVRKQRESLHLVVAVQGQPVQVEFTAAGQVIAQAMRTPSR